MCLSIIPKFANLIEYSAMKNSLLPRIKKLCIATSYLSVSIYLLFILQNLDTCIYIQTYIFIIILFFKVRVNCLVCLGKLLEHLDKWLVLDEILPFLPQIPSKEPAVLMGILGNFYFLNLKKFNFKSKLILITDL